MAYMKDSTGKRLDSFPVSDARRVASAPVASSPGTFDRPRSVYNLKPYHLFRTRAKLGAVRAGLADFKLGVVAHSMGAGVGAVGGVSDFPSVFCGILNNAGFPVNSSGLVGGYRGSAPLDPRWNWGTGWAAFGATSNLMANSTTTNAAVMTSTTTGTIVEIAFGKTSSSGAYSITIDGGAPVTITPTGGSNVVYFYTVTGLADTTHTVSISRTVAGGGAGYIFGVEVRKGVGVRLYNGGIGGAKASAPADASFYSTAPFASNGMDVNNGANKGWNSDLILLGPIMANDLFAGTTTATWKGQVQTAINNCKTTSAGAPQPADIVLIADTPVAGIDASAYRTALYELADANDLPLLDMLDRWTSYTLANTHGLMSDGTHPNARGYADEARALFLALAL